MLHFHNDGTGGGDYCTHAMLKRKRVGGAESTALELALAEWCATTPEFIAFEKDFEEKYGERDKLSPPYPERKPSTDATTSIWAGELGEAMQLQQVIARKIKRTIVFHKPGKATERLQFYTMPRGQVMSDAQRVKLAKQVLAEDPTLVIHGLPEGIAQEDLS